MPQANQLPFKVASSPATYTRLIGEVNQGWAGKAELGHLWDKFASLSALKEIDDELQNREKAFERDPSAVNRIHLLRMLSLRRNARNARLNGRALRASLEQGCVNEIYVTGKQYVLINPTGE